MTRGSLRRPVLTKLAALNLPDLRALVTVFADYFLTSSNGAGLLGPVTISQIVSEVQMGNFLVQISRSTRSRGSLQALPGSILQAIYLSLARSVSCARNIRDLTAASVQPKASAICP